MTKVLAALALTVATAAFATPPFSPILLPVYTAPTPGAYGSLWISEVMLHNPEALPMTIVVCTDECRDVTLPAGSHSDALSSYAAAAGQPPGLLIGVYLPSSLSVSLRVRDVSRSAQSFGVELPPVNFGPGTFIYRRQLLNVPLASPFRYKLRLYDVGGGPRTAHVHVFDDDTGDDLLEADVPLSVSRRLSYGEIDPFSFAIVSQRAGHHARIEISAQDGGAINTMWALLTITNNDTQEVTAVTPAQ
ncbi:MAG TPA: hypothetical protein VG323_12590 [Thermoanaerobaculia bacterium]|nr:hypothetical protein [Thermoanaerobaculia bacterium]